jgi:protein-disulfide isomerase
MAADGRSMKPFYVALGVIAAVGGALIVSRLGGGSRAPLTTTAAAPLPSGPRGIVLGSETALVEVTEFSDFECPYCARFAVIQMPDVRQRLIEAGRVRWRFVHYPLAMHARAPEAHLAAACAARQNRFWDLKQVLFQNQDEWVASRRPAQVIAQYAERAGLDMASYRRCVDEREAWGEVLADKALGDSLGVSGTPTFYINGRYWTSSNYSADAIRRTVDSIYAAAASPARD